MILRLTVAVLALALASCASLAERHYVRGVSSPTCDPGLYGDKGPWPDGSDVCHQDWARVIHAAPGDEVYRIIWYFADDGWIWSKGGVQVTLHADGTGQIIRFDQEDGGLRQPKVVPGATIPMTAERVARFRADLAAAEAAGRALPDRDVTCLGGTEALFERVVGGRYEGTLVPCVDYDGSPTFPLYSVFRETEDG